MDSIPDPTIAMIAAFDYRIEGDLSNPPEVFQLLLYVVADLRLSFHGQTMYEEESFPVVELASALERWKSGPLPLSFEFRSMESDCGPLIYFEYSPRGYRIGSVHQCVKCDEWLEEKALLNLVDAYCHDVRLRTTALLGFDALETVLK